ncbi:general transcription factor 3C polypeptide 4 [Pelobates fuscus]|uniref:general transcription factor 3C polypeptide 4 n=1 Tax=Pelobates fuscus TaxID=191477 RepID=UPI002FE475F1
MSEEGKSKLPEQDSRSQLRLSVYKREPSVKLLHPVSGLEPVSWSEDHRLSVCTRVHLSVLEQVYDINGSSPDLSLHRTSLPVPTTTCRLKVGSSKDVERCKELFSEEKDPALRQTFVLDRVFNPEGKFMPPLAGFRYATWSPVGCDVNGRCLLATLTMDNRLTINANVNRLQWKTLIDLTEKYGERILQANYRVNENENENVNSNLGDFTEFKRRYSMQTPVRMEWSGICTIQQVFEDNICKDVSTLLLAVLFENADVAVWQFQLPVVGNESIVSCNTIESGIQSPSTLAWWEYEHNNRKMSGLIVGSSLGPIKLLPVNLKAVKGYFTLRQPVILWKETDMLPVQIIKCIALHHPYQKCTCSLVVAARGPYVFWCLLLISKAGLNVHNSHVTGLHSLPILSMAVDKLNGTTYTNSVDGKVRQLIPTFTDVALKFEHKLVNLSDIYGSVKCHGISVSPSGAYMACITSEGIKNGLHPVDQNYKINFLALKTFEEAAAQLLEGSQQNLFRQMDLTDLVRWKILKEKIIPQFLADALDKKTENGSLYFWRFRLFLLRVWYQSHKKFSSETRKPCLKQSKVPKTDDPLQGSTNADDPENQDEASPSKQTDTEIPSGTSKQTAEVDNGSPSEHEGLEEIQKKIDSVEAHLFRENMKRVLGEVYMHTCVIENTRIPTKGICESLSLDKDGNDQAAQVLIGYIEKKMYKQTFHEYCTLCKEVLPFSDRKKTTCPNGHIWLRCSFTYQACQSLLFRRCLLNDSIAVNPIPGDADWIKKLLQGPCVLCDSPVF